MGPKADQLHLGTFPLLIAATVNEPKYVKCSCEGCGGHIEFPPEGAGMTISCPHCGWKTELAAPKPQAAENDLAGNARDKIRVIAAVALILGGAGAFAYWKIGRTPEIPAAKPELKATGKSTLTNKSAETSQSPFQRTSNLRVGSIALEKSRNSSVVYAVGVIKNESDHQRFGLRIELDLLDTAGLKIGTATDYLAILEPGKDWRFKALVLDAKAVSARLVAIREEE